MSDSNDFGSGGGNDTSHSKYNGDGDFRDETDLSGMDVASAREYVMAYITTLKQTQQKMKETAAELELWQQRVSFAAERGRPDLRSAADMKVKEISDSLERLRTEEYDLAAKTKTLIENLKKLKAGFVPSVDAEQLQAELDMITGERDEVAEKFREEDALNELEKLKQKMKDSEST
ncbi:MAG: hypothetical protein JW881_19745 [Spirochaetales bacterium]|nr:hypothetical protein [Spirochaetales bacterium]